MSTLLQDLRFAARMLFKKPGFAAVAVLTLALGIGANTAIFSVVYGVVLRALPYPDSDRLVQLYTQFPSMKFDRFWFSPPEFFELQEESASYESIGGWNNSDAAVAGGTEPVRVMASYTSGKLFETVGVQPLLGRQYSQDSTLPGAPAVAVLGYGLWQRAFGGDLQVVGKTIRVDGVATEVVGVMPRTFDFPDRSVELWVPQKLDPAETDNRGSHFISVIGRLKPGISVEQARAELDPLMAKSEERHKDDHPQSRAKHPMVLYSLHEELVGDVRPGLLMLLGAVGFVLLISCANVASLLLARAAARAKEIAVRTALGAGRGRLVRQFLTESLVLSLLGGALGLVLARWGLDLILAINPDIIPRTHQIGIDGRILLFTLGLSLATGVLFGLAPVAHLHLGALAASLKSGVRGSTEGPERQGFRRVLVVVEVALAVVLVIGSGLMLRSFSALMKVDPGFKPQGLVTMELALPEASYPKPEQVLDFFARLQTGLHALPGVQGVTLMTGLPPNRRINANDISFEGLEQSKDGPVWNVDFWQQVADDYFKTMGIRLVEGRLFSETDREGAPGAVLVNETMARRFWPGQSPVGRQLRVTPWLKKVPPQTVVGVVADVKQQGLGAPTGTEVYMPLRQMPEVEGGAERDIHIVARAASGDPIALVTAIRGVIRTLDSTLPVARVRTMDEVFQSAVAKPWFLTMLLAVFAGVALVLAAIGVYGVLAFAVSQRTNEIGIRMALGAQSSHVLRLVVGQGFGLVALGVVLGLGAAGVLTRLMQGLLFGVASTDPLTFASVPLVLAAVALLACAVPALRAVRVDPIVALRYE
jgi:putative ABC transport system permease protein